MKIGTYHEGGTRIGVIDGDEIVDVGFDGSMTDVIESWVDLRPRFQAAAAEGKKKALCEVKLGAPIGRPGKIFAIGLNYADHIEEMNLQVPTQQVWFTKAQTSINGPFDPILIAPTATMVDYEIELVAVIGKKGRDISSEKAPNHVFGYCVGNDVTDRGWQRGSGGQWCLGKSFDTHAPTGPWITTSDEIPDPHILSLTCTVNGKVRQQSNTRHLIFNLWEQIAHLSKVMTLEPGDLIFTGTPGGVGDGMKPPSYLQHGDVVRCEVEGLGVIQGIMSAQRGV